MKELAAHPDVERLTDLMPRPDPPGQPTAATPWDRAHAEAGLLFPRTYRDFAGRFGGGLACGQLFVHVPTSYPSRFAPAGFAGFRKAAAYQTNGSEPPTPEPHDTAQDPPSLLRWGTTDTAEWFWSTVNNDPDHWPVEIWDHNTRTWHHFEGGMTALLIAIIEDTYGPGRSLIPGAGADPDWIRSNDWERPYDGAAV